MRVSCRENDSVDAALHEFLERLGISLPERANRAVYKLRAKLCSTTSFVQDSAPKLIIEKMDFSRYADSNPKASLGHRQSARRQVRRIGYLSRNLQYPLARRFVDPVAPMQGAIHRPDRDVSQFGDQMDSASFLLLHALTHTRFTERIIQLIVIERVRKKAEFPYRVR